MPGDLVIGLIDALGVEVLADLARDIMAARLLKVRHDDSERIAVGFGAGEPKLFRRP